MGLNMKKSRLLVMIIVLILTASALLLTTRSNWFVNGTSNAIALIDNIVSKPFHALEDIKNDLTNLVHTYRENEELKSSLYEKEMKANESDSLKEENAQLRKLLSMQDSLSSQLKISSDVIARTPSSWKNELTINVGSDSNVQSSMLAIGSGGLIGSVSQVGKQSSRINLLTNKKNAEKISVSIQNGSKVIYGIITGYDEKKEAFIISQLNEPVNLKEGSEVFTSGLGSYTVANIPVGKVLAVIESSDHLTKEIYVKPSADFSDIRVVTLVGN